MNSGKIVADGTGRDGKIEGSTRGPRGPKNDCYNLFDSEKDLCIVCFVFVYLHTSVYRCICSRQSEEALSCGDLRRCFLQKLRELPRLQGLLAPRWGQSLKELQNVTSTTSWLE